MLAPCTRAGAPVFALIVCTRALLSACTSQVLRAPLPQPACRCKGCGALLPSLWHACIGIPPPADMDFAYVHDAKLVKECGGDCKSPFVVMYKQGESESPR